MADTLMFPGGPSQQRKEMGRRVDSVTTGKEGPPSK